MADTATIDVEHVNVAEILGREDAQAEEKKFEAALAENPAAMKVFEAVKSVEDAYEIAKKFVQIKLEEFKVLFEKTVNYFKDTKTALDDETLDCVSGGWGFSFLSDFWNEHKFGIVFGSILVAGVVVGAIAGAATGGVFGAVIGACAGGVVGAFIGMATAERVTKA